VDLQFNASSAVCKLPQKLVVGQNNWLAKLGNCPPQWVCVMAGSRLDDWLRVKLMNAPSPYPHQLNQLQRRPNDEEIWF